MSTIQFELFISNDDDVEEKILFEEPLFFGDTQLRLCDMAIVSLEGIPSTITDLFIPYNPIKSLKGIPPMLTHLVIHDCEIASLEGLPPTLSHLEIYGNLLTSLEGLPQMLEYLDITDNQITKLENLPPTLTELRAGCNQIAKLENLPLALFELHIGRNQITKLENLPPGLGKLDIGDNLLTSLPIDLVHLRNLRYFIYSGNPIELGDMHPSVQRFIQYVEERSVDYDDNTIYDDKQNVHNIDIQNSIRDSLNKLTTYPQKLTTSKLPEEEYEFLDSDEVHSFFHFTQKEVLLFAENAISLHTDEVKSELYSLLKEALREGRKVCSTGRIGRLVNVLSGFDDNVQIKISNNSQIGAIVSSFRARDESKEKVEEELLSRGIEKEEINKWLKHY